MTRKTILTLISSTAMATALLATSNVAQAWNMGNMMNPGKWFDDDDDDHYRYRYYRGGYGYGPYGWGGGPYGWGGGPYGGWGGYPGYGYGQAPSTIVVNPSSESKSPPPPKLPE